MEKVLKNLKRYFEKEKTTGHPWLLKKPMKRMEMATGLTRSKIAMLLRTQSEQSITQTRKPRAGKLKLDSFDVGRIRAAVHRRYLKNERVSLSVLAGDLVKEEDFPTISRSSLKNYVRRCGFRFFKNGAGRRFAKERQDIVSRRHDYLRRVRDARKRGECIVYVDETWVNANHCTKGEWCESSVSDSSKLLVGGSQSGGFGRCIPSGKGQRLIVLDAGCRGVGLLPGVGEMFVAKHDGGDYHSEMNHEHFFGWWQNTLLPALPGPSTIVIDNAPYHSMMTDSSRSPTTASTKDAIKLWLTGRGLSFTDDMVKAELLDIVRRNKPQPVYIVDELAKQAGHKVLRLPPRHCELNPIELVWAKMKGYVARNNSTFKLANTKALFLKSRDEITVDYWASCEDHVISKVESELWRVDGVQEEEIAPVVIDLDLDSDSDSDVSDDDDMDEQTDEPWSDREHPSATTSQAECASAGMREVCQRVIMDDSDKENDCGEIDVETDVCKTCKGREPPNRSERKRCGKRKKDVEWIYCDVCDGWFHNECEKVKTVSEGIWLCRACSAILSTRY